MDNLTLAGRQGLPDAQKELLESHPRDGREGHHDFGAPIRFWLDRHLPDEEDLIVPVLVKHGERGLE